MITTEEPSQTDCRLGVLAFGDSITNGGGELQWGVALQSWALWLARGLGLPFTGCAVDGAVARDVVSEQIPGFIARCAAPRARYDVGCLYVGVNDVRALDWDVSRFEPDFRAALAFLAERCERTIALTAPLDLGRPRAGRKVEQLNRAVETAAGDLGTLVLDQRTFGARNQVMTDHVHPTAFGQIAIAERALHVLERDGLAPRAHPSQLIRYETTWWQRLRSDLTYSYRHAKVSGRAAYITWTAARLRPSPHAGAAPASP